MTDAVEQYRAAVALDVPVAIAVDPGWRTRLRPLLARLGVASSSGEPLESLLYKLHGVLARVEPGVLDEETLRACESVAAGWASAKERVDPLGLPTVDSELPTTYSAAGVLSIFVGDISILAADAIVNAANTALLGCRAPNHACIDNVIHSAAGPRLREDCATVLAITGAPEPEGVAKITRAYALPSKFVLHTVGPQLVRGRAPTPEQAALLAGCYRSCLDTASAVQSIRTVAFCGISTGVFAYPKPAAVQVALRTIEQWVAASPGRFDRIVIDCYSPGDAHLYREALRAWPPAP